MHRRHSLGLAGAAALVVTALAGGGTAHAETGEGPPTAFAGGSTDVVVLPTGDTVTVFSDGTTGLLPAEGRENVGFLSLPAPDGSSDLLVIPYDKVEAVKAGEEDPRRYNVTDLAAAGITDAGAVAAAELEGVGDAGLGGAAIATDAAEAHKFSVQIVDRSGNVPQENLVILVENSTGAFTILEFDAGGFASEALEPGDYTVVHGIWNNTPDVQRTEITLGMTPVTMGTSQSLLVLDAADASPVTVDVPRPDAEMQVASISLGTVIEGRRFGYTDYAGPETEIFLMPGSEVPDENLEFGFRPVLTSPEGADDAYTYNLAFLATDLLPADTAYTVAEAELAAVDTEYHDLGVPVPGFTCTYGDRIGEDLGATDCAMVRVDLPTERIEYYNADTSMEWPTQVMGGRIDEDGWGIAEGFTSTATLVLDAGERSSRDMVNGPFGGGAADGALLGFDEAGALELRLSPGTGYAGEELRFLGYEATAALSKDGNEIATWEGDPEDEEIGFELDGAGRYTLAVEGARDAATGLFATESALEWTFDADPASAGDEGYTPFSLPTVAFDAEGVEGGWADAWCSQDVALSLEPGAFGDADARLTAVELENVGDTAAGTLRHPRGAEFVSIRVNAADDGGNEIAYTTIRSYGLR